ncbi:hypothetical protein M0R45_008662 [Rubus argutus]|uniref:Uncharacterized protein n=1 Tax=Rubus argutus TaxID=59490 RepID=A0AAW1Y2S9_RUBAR
MCSREEKGERLGEFHELQAEAVSPGSDDSKDSISADKVAESLIKALEERNTQFVRNSLDTYAKEINGTVRELAKIVTALSVQMQDQQATLCTVLNERATFMSLLYKHDFPSKEKRESSNTVAEDVIIDTKVSKLRFKVGMLHGKRSLPNMDKTTKGVGFKKNPSREVSVVAKSSHQTNKASSSKQAEIEDDDSDPENFMEEFTAQTSQAEEKKKVTYYGTNNEGLYLFSDEQITGLVRKAVRRHLSEELGYNFPFSKEIAEVNYPKGHKTINFTLFSGEDACERKCCCAYC